MQMQRILIKILELILIYAIGYNWPQVNLMELW